MRKGLVFLFAALLVVGLPLSSALAAGTTGVQIKDAAYAWKVFHFALSHIPINRVLPLFSDKTSLRNDRGRSDI